ncbi:TonB-dependent receptor domain-containing protein [Duganella guangzhouensis]|uniref:TonB-dependent receptor domain-containing protein n=1 Tax=Duganella guangzhouensis TaxID=2666084 RepID=UPI001E33F944|nr:TonB-dependent receptor [Duganella guangzhouensis]
MSRSIRLMSVGGVVLGMHMAAMAQDAAPEAMQKVEVTGSRIPTLVTEGSSPITVLSQKDIKADGVRNAEDLLNNLPQAFAGQGAAVSNGATGTATVNLRNLGADRTLVLVNGKRLPAGSVNSSAPDLNEIPAGLIKRVEVLTGGAGAVYGAGAVAGVVNFILRDNFEGVEVQANLSGYNHQQHSDVASVVQNKGFALPGDAKFDGKTKDVSVLMGGNFADGKGNATVYFSYKETDAALQSQRDFTSCALSGSNSGYSCLGSGTQASGRVTAAADKTTGYAGGAFTNNGSGGVKAYTSADSYNYGPLNYLQRPSQNWNVTAQAHYDIDDKTRVYSEFGFHNYSTDAQIAAGGIFYGIQTTLHGDNPLLSDAWLAALGLTKGDYNSTRTVTIGKRNVEGGPRISSIADTSFREVLGVKGEVGNWTYDVFGQYARVNHSEQSKNYFSAARIAKAMDVVNVNGKAVCASYANGSDLNCVPYNLYGGTITPEQLAYLSASGQIGGYVQQIVYGGNIGTDLGVYGIKSPWSSNGVGVSFGVEHRAEKLAFIPDETSLSGDLSGGSGASPALTNGFNVKEIFGEFRLPVVENLAFAKSLDLTGSYRHSDYSTNRKSNTYGVGADWGVVDQLRVRGSYQKAVRAPTISDLYNPTTVGNNGPTSDPCSGTSPSATLAECARSGVTAAQYGTIEANSSNQYHSQTGGTATLAPERGTTYTLGLVLNPVKNLTMTLDYFNIKIKDTISAIDPTIALNQCLETGAALFCSLIHRDSQGSLWLTDTGYVVQRSANIGSVATSGFDLGASYSQRVGQFGSLAFNLNGTLMKSSSVENVPGLGSYDCTGYFGATCGTPTPKWRHKFRTTWSSPWKADVALTWRYIGRTKSELLSDNALLAGDTPATIEDHLSARNYFDLNVQYPLTKKVSLSAGINNLFDKDPPIVSTNVTAAAGTANGNTYPQVYDSMGRFIYVNVTARF